MTTNTKTDRIVIKGVAGFDGEYAIDQTALTWGDLRFIQSSSGVMAGELDEHLKRGNLELIVAFAKIALRRQGHPYVDRFDEALDSIPLEGDPPITYIGADDDEEADPADPPRAGEGNSG